MVPFDTGLALLIRAFLPIRGSEMPAAVSQPE